MKSLTDFAKQPTLIEIVIDAPDIVEEFGDVVKFYMNDYLDITTYFDFYRAQTGSDGSLEDCLRKIILNDQGQPCLKPGFTLPVNLAVAVLGKVNENLGKLKTKPSTKEAGTQPA
jgi:hypothetical protein